MKKKTVLSIILIIIIAGASIYLFNNKSAEIKSEEVSENASLDLQDYQFVLSAANLGYSLTASWDGNLFSVAERQVTEECRVSQELTSLEKSLFKQELEKINLEKLASYERPSFNSARDADAGAKLTITHNNDTYTSQGFDLTNAPIAYKSFVDAINDKSLGLCP